MDATAALVVVAAVFLWGAVSARLERADLVRGLPRRSKGHVHPRRRDGLTPKG